jgi:hypothetical protein
MYVPSLKNKISELLARQIGLGADAILRQYGLGQLKSLDDTYDAILYVNNSILKQRTKQKSSNFSRYFATRPLTFIFYDFIDSIMVVSTLGGPFETLPTELLQSLAAHVQKICSCSSLLLLTILSPCCEIVNFSSLVGPLELVEFCMRRLSAGVRKVQFPVIKEEDKLLAALAESPAAATLQKMNFNFFDVSLTDASSATWKHFQSLEVVVAISSGLTWKTADEIVKLPKLRKLRIDSDRLSGTQLIEKVIDMNLQLEYLGCLLPDESLQPEIDKVIELLRKNHAFAARLRALELSTCSYADLDNLQIWNSFQQVCPNLTRAPAIIPYRHLELSQALPRFRSLNARQKCVTQQDVDLLGSKCAELETLTVDAEDFQADDLRSLRLRFLEMDLVTNLNAEIRFPSCLRTLRLYCRAPFENLDAILNRIASTLPALEEFSVSGFQKIETSTYLNLMSSLTNLRWLSARLNFSESAGPVVEVNHPNIRYFPGNYGSGFTHVPGSLPNLQDLFLGNRDDDRIKLSAGNALRLRGVRDLLLCTPHWDITFARNLKLLDTLELAGTFQDPLPVDVLELDHLQQLSLNGYNLTESFCASVIQKVTRLQCLRLVTSGKAVHNEEIRSLDWIQHPLLQDLTLDNLGEFTLPGELLPFVFNASQLPFLTEISLAFHTNTVLPPSVTVSSLRSLKSFRLYNHNSEEGEAPASLELVCSQCPNLRGMNITGVGLHGLVLVDLPLLNSLFINDCPIKSSSEALQDSEHFTFAQLPSLLDFAINASQEEGQRKLVEDLGARIRACNTNHRTEDNVS